MKTADLWPPDIKPWKISSTYALIGLFTLPFNVTGQPAISLPLHQTPDGLPVGVQIAANMGHDELLLRLSARTRRSNAMARSDPSDSRLSAHAVTNDGVTFAAPL